MVERVPPQPHPSRLTDFAGHAIVVAAVPGQAPLVGLTAASLARATGAPAVYFAYVDQTRYTDEEFPDGTVRHLPINPDAAGDASPKHSTGRLVSSPTVPAVMPRSVCRSTATAEMATSGPRRFSASSNSPASAPALDGGAGCGWDTGDPPKSVGWAPGAAGTVPNHLPRSARCGGKRFR